MESQTKTTVKTGNSQDKFAVKTVESHCIKITWSTTDKTWLFRVTFEVKNVEFVSRTKLVSDTGE